MSNLVAPIIDAQWEEPYRPRPQNVSQCRECKIMGLCRYLFRNEQEPDDSASSPRHVLMIRCQNNYYEYQAEWRVKVRSINLLSVCDVSLW